MKLVVLAALFMVISCGKESTGSSSSDSTSSLYTSGTLSTTSSAAATNAATWYQSTTEGNYYSGTTLRTEYRIVRVYPTSSCSTVSSFYVCSATTSYTSSTTATRTVYPVVSGNTKATNTTLAAIFSGSVGTITNVTTAANPSGGTYYSFQIAKANGYVILYTIDTGINSAFNPIYSLDSETRTESILYQII